MLLVEHGAEESIGDLDEDAGAVAGVRLGAGGRLVIRPSGTEPLVRVMAEGDDADLVESVVDDVCAALGAAA